MSEIRWCRGFRYCCIENVIYIDFRPEYRGLPLRSPRDETEPLHVQ